MTINETDLQKIYNNIYPVGAYYFSNNSTDPTSLFGGSWIRITDCFLYTVQNITNFSGGNSTAYLTYNALGSHTHSYSHSHTGISHNHSDSQSAHTHTISAHTHTGTTSSHTHKVFSNQWTLVYSAIQHRINKNSPAGGLFVTSHYDITASNTASTTYGAVAATSLNSNSASIGSIGNYNSTNSSSGGSGTSGSASVGVTNYTGSGSSFSIIPYYKGYYVWYRYA